MIVIGAALTGAFLGGFNARKRGGAVADVAQYATIFAILFTLGGLLATLMIHRLLV